MQKVIFLEDTAPIIVGIVKKYNIEEPPQEIFAKMEKGERLHGEIILDITKRVALDKNLQKDLSAIIQKELNVSAEIAIKIVGDIQNQLLPIAKNADAAADTFKNKTNRPIIDKPHATEPTAPKTPKTLGKKSIDAIKKRGDIEKTQIIEEKKITHNKNDAYREPIE